MVSAICLGLLCDAGLGWLCGGWFGFGGCLFACWLRFLLHGLLRVFCLAYLLVLCIGCIWMCFDLLAFVICCCVLFGLPLRTSGVCDVLGCVLLNY